LQGLPFHVDERVIVPRSLIAEVLADGTLDAWLSARTYRVLDLCTGNGSLAVLAALAWPDVQVNATDLSADALAVAQLNVRRHGVADRITLAPGRRPGRRRRAATTWCCATRPTSTAAVDGGPAGRVPRRAGAGAGRRARRHGLHPPAAARPAGARLISAPGGVLCWKSATSALTSKPPFRDLPAVWLPTSAGDDQVLLIESKDLA
jgi:ribosomal protein L3 glutamine methyltransferase